MVPVNGSTICSSALNSDRGQNTLTETPNIGPVVLGDKEILGVR